MTRLSIIIPTYNTREMTLDCLRGIHKFPPSQPYEIIVVDNHSQDQTAERVREFFPEAVVIENPVNTGFAKACNRGARDAKGEFLCFLNSDTEPKANTFDVLLNWMDSHPRTGIVGPELIGENGDLIQMSWSWNPVLFYELIQQYFAPYDVRHSALKRFMIKQLQSLSRSVPSICGACLMIRRKAFEQISGFDEDFELYFEDSDLCFRCLKAGWQIDFIAESKIIHRLGRSTSGSWSTTSLIYQQSHITYYRKHAPGWGLWLLKTYLMIKWARLYWRTKKDTVDPKRGTIYCRAYKRMALEKERYTLEKGLPIS